MNSSLKQLIWREGALHSIALLSCEGGLHFFPALKLELFAVLRAALAVLVL
jgi:hypothetical protein